MTGPLGTMSIVSRLFHSKSHTDERVAIYAVNGNDAFLTVAKRRCRHKHRKPQRRPYRRPARHRLVRDVGQAKLSDYAPGLRVRNPVKPVSTVASKGMAGCWLRGIGDGDR